MESEHIEVVTPKFVILRSSGNPTPNLLNHYKYHSQDDMHETLEWMQPRRNVENQQGNYKPYVKGVSLLHCFGWTRH